MQRQPGVHSWSQPIIVVLHLFAVTVGNALAAMAQGYPGGVSAPADYNIAANWVEA